MTFTDDYNSTKSAITGSTIAIIIVAILIIYVKIRVIIWCCTRTSARRNERNRMANFHNKPQQGPYGQAFNNNNSVYNGMQPIGGWYQQTTRCYDGSAYDISRRPVKPNNDTAHLLRDVEEKGHRKQGGELEPLPPAHRRERPPSPELPGYVRGG